MQASIPRPALLPHKKTTASWLQVLSHLAPSFGGIAASVPQFCLRMQAHNDYRYPIAGFCEPSELKSMTASEALSIGQFPPQRTRWMLDPRLRKRFRQLIRESNGVHIHGIWEPHCHVAAGISRACKRPYLISAHGMLDQWALKHKRLKKALYAAFIETRNLQAAACLRALTRHEVEDYRRIGLTNPVAIVPTGVEAPPNVSSDRFFEAHPELTGKRIVLFLGRLHPKKGLDILIDAWTEIAPKFSDAHLVLAGPDFENQTGLLRSRVEQFGLHFSVTLAGMLKGAEKWAALAAASVFVLPSYSEGFSVAVLEALALGIPVIVSTACHIPEVEEHGAGWVIKPERDALTGALENFFRLPAEEAASVGRQGRQLVDLRFSWSAVGKQMASVYDWVLGGTQPPGIEM